MGNREKYRSLSFYFHHNEKKADGSLSFYFHHNEKKQKLIIFIYFPLSKYMKQEYIPRGRISTAAVAATRCQYLGESTY